jgi:hypothetical protein
MALDYTTAAEALSEVGTLHTGLMAGLPAAPTFPSPVTITIPSVGAVPIDLSGEIVQPTTEELTIGAVSGTGVFDKLMTSIGSHIEGQYHKGIIGQSDLAAIYIASIQAAMPQAIQFVLSKEKAYWDAKLTQVQTQNTYLERALIVANVETAKLTAYKTQAEAYTAQVNAFTAQVLYSNAKLQLTKTLQEINNLEIQQAVGEANFDAAFVQTHNLLPDGTTPTGHTSREFLLKDSALVTATKQQDLLTAQTNVQRAQTYDTNTDLTTVGGVIGIQKALYTQQIQSYKDDGQNKGVKTLADLWTSSKALDDATPSPGPLAGNLIIAMNKYLNNLGLPNAFNNPDTPATGVPSADADWMVSGDQ